MSYVLPAYHTMGTPLFPTNFLCMKRISRSSKAGQFDTNLTRGCKQSLAQPSVGVHHKLPNSLTQHVQRVSHCCNPAECLWELSSAVHWQQESPCAFDFFIIPAWTTILWHLHVSKKAR